MLEIITIEPVALPLPNFRFVHQFHLSVGNYVEYLTASTIQAVSRDGV